MAATQNSSPDLMHVAKRVLAHRKRWMLPTAVIALLAVGFALRMQPSWQATQALSLRDEAVGGLSRPGRFSHSDEMKTAQETVLELARSRVVVEAALRRVGPPEGCEFPERFPTHGDIDAARSSITLRAPNGAEFGRTEVFYLKVRDHDRQRALDLTQAVCDEMMTRLSDLRDAKAQSMIRELAEGVRVAQADLEAATAKLADMERSVGKDLGELRLLNETASGESNLRTQMTSIRHSLREAEDARRSGKQLLAMLRSARRDPQKLIATPGRLLESQPALRRLKDGLVDAQLRASTLLGRMSPQHPEVQAAEAAHDEVRRRLFAELDTAIRGQEAEIAVADSRIEALRSQLAEVDRRMAHLAGLRASYSNLVAQARHRAESLTKAQAELAKAKASRGAAGKSSLVTRVGEAAIGDRPEGGDRAGIVLAGLVGGLVTGFGFTFLSVPQDELLGRQVKSDAAPAAAPWQTAQPAKAARRGRGLSLNRAFLKMAG